MAASGRVRDSRRMVLARQLMTGGRFCQLMVVSRCNGLIAVAPFERETAATLFVDTPLALIRGDITDATCFDTLNSIPTFDSLVAYLRNSGLTDVDGCGDVRVMKIMVGNCAILEI